MYLPLKDGFEVLVVVYSRNEIRDCYISPKFRQFNQNQNC